MQLTTELFLVFCVISKLLPGSADVLVGFVLSDADGDVGVPRGCLIVLHVFFIFTN